MKGFWIYMRECDGFLLLFSCFQCRSLVDLVVRRSAMNFTAIFSGIQILLIGEICTLWLEDWYTRMHIKHCSIMD
jgi:hypothetical protein